MHRLTKKLVTSWNSMYTMYNNNGMNMKTSVLSTGKLDGRALGKGLGRAPD